jgi:uncharacterized integral membrane protein (TIGR02327 family)
MMNMGTDVDNVVTVAADGLIFMIAFLGGTYVAWWALGVLRWEKFVLDPGTPQARMLRFLMAILGGFVISVIAVCYVIAGQALRLLM